MSPRSARRSIAAAAAAVTIAVALTGCAGAKSALGPSAGVCFKALPGANVAVHRKGHLVGVRLVDASLLQQRLPTDTALDALAPKTSLCVFAYSGAFTSSLVTGAPPGLTGTYAVVALTGSRPRVVAASVVNQLPTRFRHARV
jgi:hypothetical protein